MWRGPVTAGGSVLTHPSGVRHHSFFHGAEGQRLFTVLYEPAGRARLGVVACPAWGADGSKMLVWSHQLAHDLAALGILTAVFNWPGTEDSEGDLDSVDLDTLVQSATDTITACAQRADVPAWGLLGLRFGAGPAAVAAAGTNASHLVLVQPVLDPAAHFVEIERSSRRAQLRSATPEHWAFGHPHPAGLRERGHATTITNALRAFAGRGAVIQYRRPAGISAPAPFRDVRVWGDWRRPPRVDHGPLRVATRRWIRRSLGGRA